jgi:hypothetical protein
MKFFQPFFGKFCPGTNPFWMFQKFTVFLSLERFKDFAETHDNYQCFLKFLLG